MQPAPQIQYGTFPCPSCGGELPKTMPKGLVFPCPYCQGRVESPGSDITADQAAQYQAWAMQHGAAAASLADQAHRQQTDPANAIFASVASVRAAVIGGKVYFLGAAVAADGSWSMRLVDPSTRQVVWESLQGSRWAYPPSEQKIAMRGDRLYIGIEGRLHALQLSTGRHLWSAMLHGNVETHPDHAHYGDELRLFDFPRQGVEGVVVVQMESGLVAAWGRDTGGARWSQHYDSPKLYPVPELGVIVDADETAVYLRADDGAALATWSGDEHPDDIATGPGRIALRLSIEVDGWSETFVRLLDARSLQVLAQHPVNECDFGDRPAFVGDRFYTPVTCVGGSQYHVVDPAQAPKGPGFFGKLFGNKPGREHIRLPVPKLRFEAMVPCGSFIMCDLRAYEGEGRRLLALDPATLQLRYDSGPLPDSPKTMSDHQVATDGRLAIYVTAPSGDSKQCELRAIDSGTGQQVWSVAIGDWTMHHVEGEHVVLYHHPDDGYSATSVYRAADGELVSRYPFS